VRGPDSIGEAVVRPVVHGGGGARRHRGQGEQPEQERDEPTDHAEDLGAGFPAHEAGYPNLDEVSAE
jgi:hypothetical protein